MKYQLPRGPITLIVLALAIGACQAAGYSVVSQKPVDASYAVTNFSMRTEGYDNQTCTAAVHTKFYNEAGFLGICGFILNTGKIGCGDGYLSQKLTDAVFADATLMINDTVISKAGFYTLREFGTTASGAAPICVRTDTAWRENFTYAKPTFKFSGFTQVSE